MRRLATVSAALPLALVVALPSLGASQDSPVSGVEITYLANEGFLLEAGETRVLVDALFGDGLTEYPVVSGRVRDDLETARGRFAGIDLILASHAHADHFDPTAVARHLRANPDAVFLSTEEAVAALSEELGEAAARFDLVAAAPASGESVLLERPGVEVQALDLHHGRLPIDNLGLVIGLGGLEVLHVGDTSASAADLRPYRSLLAVVDVWLLPDWLIGEPDWEAARAAAEGATWLVNMHLAAPTAPAAWFGSAGSHAGRITRVREALPGVWIPVAPLETRTFPPAR